MGRWGMIFNRFVSKKKQNSKKKKKKKLLFFFNLMEKDDINSKPIRIKRVFFGSRVKKESAQSQALPVAVPRLGRTIFSDEPETAEEYLLMVAQEAAREPDVVVAYFSDEEEGEHQASCFGLVDDLIVPEDYESEFGEEEGEEGSEDEDWEDGEVFEAHDFICLLYTSPSPRD